MILYSFEMRSGGVDVASFKCIEVAGTTGYTSRGSRPDRPLLIPHGCCQHFRPPFQWKPSFFSLVLTSCIGGMLNSSQTHLPTTWAWSHNSGTWAFMRSRSARVFAMLASFVFTITFFPPSACANRLLLVRVTLAGSSDGIPVQREVGFSHIRGHVPQSSAATLFR